MDLYIVNRLLTRDLLLLEEHCDVKRQEWRTSSIQPQYCDECQILYKLINYLLI